MADNGSNGRAGAAVLNVVHASPGRIRLREHPDPRHSPNGAFDAALRAIEQVDGIEGVRAVPLAHSIVVEFDPEAETVDEVLSLIESAGVHLEAPQEPRPEPEERPSSIGDAIAQWGIFADQRLSQVSGRTLDGRTVLPITFFLLAGRAYAKGPRDGPPWHTLLWYAFDSFTKLRPKSDS
jgi:hypothetical protein